MVKIIVYTTQPSLNLSEERMVKKQRFTSEMQLRTFPDSIYPLKTWLMR